MAYTDSMQAVPDLATALKRNYLLHGLSDEEIARFASMAEVKQFTGGDTLVRQFAKDTDLMIVLEGMARVNAFSGELIAEAGPGSVIGEMSMLDDKPRSATVIAKQQCTVAVISSEKLWAFLDLNPVIAKTVLLNLGRILASRLRSSNIQLDLVVTSR